MKDLGTWGEPTAMASSHMLKVKHMRESGPTTKDTARVFQIASISSALKDRSKRMSKMEWELRAGLIKALSSVIIHEANGTALESRSGQTANLTQVNIKMVELNWIGFEVLLYLFGVSVC